MSFICVLLSIYIFLILKLYASVGMLCVAKRSPDIFLDRTITYFCVICALFSHAVTEMRKYNYN
jgi:hypothetical protein